MNNQCLVKYVYFCSVFTIISIFKLTIPSDVPQANLVSDLVSNLRLVYLFALRKAISAIGLEPKEYGYHTLRRSGACWSFDNDINVDHIRTHGGWTSDVVWKYLVKTLKAAGSVARTFQQLIT